MITKEQIEESLKEVIYPGFTKSIVDFGFVKAIESNDDGVYVEIDISSSAPEVEQELKEDITKRVQLLGASRIDVVVTKPKMPKQSSSQGKNIAPHVKNFVMVSSGKGGVGKSTTTVNLAIALAMQGKKVGLLDADIYGPNIPRMMGVDGEQPEIIGNKVKPLLSHGVEVMSMGSLMEEGQSLIWRGAMIMKAIQQLLQDILWSELDVLVIDMPPGTGDAQLSLAQSVPVTAGICVTTPQKVALDDTERSLDMFKKLNIPIAGVVENMSGFICPETGKEYDIFGKGTTAPLAEKFESIVMGEIPIEPAVREGGDSGKPVVFHDPSSETAKRYQEAAEKLWNTIEQINEEGGVDNEAIQPTTPPGVSACSTGAGEAPEGNSNNNSGGGCGCN
ncbi:MAG: Mrp/NBP35 family ATP-binding protein [Epsilonproteobacteria bacterium]|nr:Mrp/NBP35 family ATP-binding protein [Campylobacterota bacterium]